MDQVEFAIASEIEGVEPTVFRAWLDALIKALRAAEEEVTGEAKAHWQWSESFRIPLSVSPNGVSSDQLLETALKTREALTQAFQAPGDRNVSATRAALSRIVNDSRRYSAPLVVAVGGEETTLDPVPPAQARRFHWAGRTLSTVEGTLRGLSERSGWTEGRLSEVDSRRSIWCRFDGTFADIAIGFYRQRILVEGQVRYNRAGQPISVIDVKSITPRDPRAKLSPFLAAAPSLTGGKDPAEFIARMRGNA